jgi:multidrug resistance efflux pump
MENPKESIFKKPWVQSLAGIFVIIVVVVAVLFFKSATSTINIEDSTVSAPVISISPTTAGILDEVYVKAGDAVTAGQTLAHIGAEVLTAKIDGLVIDVSNTPGQIFSPTQAVIKMIDPKELRIVGTIKEDAGFADISVGDPVRFTLDAFGSEEFVGYIDEISATSKDSSVVFSISDKRETKEFTVKVKYDTAAHPEFKNGMSAKIKVYNKK